MVTPLMSHCVHKRLSFSQ